MSVYGRALFLWFYLRVTVTFFFQGSIDDTLRFVMFYVSYGLLLVLLGLYTVSDRVALQYTTRLLEEERAPLLGEFSLSREDEGQQQSTRVRHPMDAKKTKRYAHLSVIICIRHRCEGEMGVISAHQARAFRPLGLTSAAISPSRRTQRYSRPMYFLVRISI